MYLLYVDESGNAEGSDSKHFVLGGVAAFERQVYWLNKAVEEISQIFFQDCPEYVEFHAQQIAQHKDPPWNSISTQTRNEVTDRVYSVLNNIRSDGTVLFSVAVERAFVEDQDVVGRAFEELCRRFDLFLQRLEKGGDNQRGLLIFDETKYALHLQRLLREFRDAAGTRFGRLKTFADVPFFADSKSTRLLQLADFVAYEVYRRYERGDTRLLDKIINRFDNQGEVFHGLVHLTQTARSCTCPACLSRRLSSAT